MSLHIALSLVQQDKCLFHSKCLESCLRPGILPFLSKAWFFLILSTWNTLGHNCNPAFHVLQFQVSLRGKHSNGEAVAKMQSLPKGKLRGRERESKPASRILKQTESFIYEGNAKNNRPHILTRVERPRILAKLGQPCQGWMEVNCVKWESLGRRFC